MAAADAVLDGGVKSASPSCGQRHHATPGSDGFCLFNNVR